MAKCPYCGEPARPIGEIQHTDDCPLVDRATELILKIAEQLGDINDMCPVCHGTGCANLVQCSHCGGSGKA